MPGNILLPILFALFLVNHSHGRQLPSEDPGVAKKYPFIHTVFNRVANVDGLVPFFEKLQSLKKKEEGIVSVVHIGDSHIQPDFLTAVIRNGLQSYFGNAGRGIVFPYQLAQSNSPDDIRSTSASRWSFNRLAHPEIDHPSGVSGFGISSGSDSVSLKLVQRPAAGGITGFDKVRVFTGTDSAVHWWIREEKESYPFYPDSIGVDTVRFKESRNEFLLSATGKGTKQVFGFSLEREKPGLFYHSIGVNGARYDQYNTASIFWRQLSALNADLFIISLGTNEAQRAVFREAEFMREVEIFIQHLQRIAPGASVLITTAPDSYKGRVANKILQEVNGSLAKFCTAHRIPFWDLYRITNGYGSAYSWMRRGLMSRDRIHFTPEGYRLMGSLLFSAMAKAYNAYAGTGQGN